MKLFHALQMGITAFVVAGSYLLSWSKDVTVASLYGSLVALTLSYLLRRDVARAEVYALSNPGKSMQVLYLGAALRFFVAIVAFIVGMQYLQLVPMALLAGFAITQIAYIIAAQALKRSN